MSVSQVDASRGQIVTLCGAQLSHSDLKTAESVTFQTPSLEVALVGAGEGNVFHCCGCLLATRPLSKGEPLKIDRFTLCSGLFSSLPLERQKSVFPFTSIELRGELDEKARECFCSREGLTVKRHPGMGDALTATAAFPVGASLYRFTARKELPVPFATVYTIAAGPGVHITPTDGAQCLAHHCDPNTHIKVDPTGAAIEVVTIKPIAPGDVVSFNYLSTEFAMDAPFDCACGSTSCYGHIAGFSKLDAASKKRLLETNTVSPVILALGASPGAAIPFTVHEQFPTAKGTVISPRVWRDSFTGVRDATSRFQLWSADNNGKKMPNACLVPLPTGSEAPEFCLVALTEIRAGGEVLAVHADAIDNKDKVHQ